MSIHCPSASPQPFRKWLITAALLIAQLTTAGAVAAETTAASSSYGEAVNLSAVPILGGGVTVTSGPVPQVGGTAPGPYTQSTSLASVAASSSLTGPILSTGVINVSASSPVPATNQAAASAEVDNPSLGIVGNLQLLTLSASQISSSAQIAGTCGTALTTTGSSQLTGAKLGGALASGTVNATPAANTELLNILGIRIVLNEQTVAGDGVTTSSLTVNAVHVYIANALLTGLGVLSGDVVIAHSQASLDCNGLPNTADLSVTKSSSPNPATVGQNLTYTITAANAGPDTATNVTVTDPLPLGVTLVSATSSQGTCSGTLSITCNLGSITAGASATVSIVILPQVAGTLVNSATASSSTSDPTPGNNTGSTSTTVNPAGGGSSADLSVNGSAAPSPATVGSQLNYSIQVANAGPNGAGDVVVTDILPAGVTFVSAGPSQGSCSGTSTVVCDLGTLANGATASVAIAVVPTAPGILIDTASVEGSVPDPNPGNNTITFSTTVNGTGGGSTQADLSLVKSAAPNPVTVGSPLTYTLAVHNAGPSAAADVVTTDTLPAGATFVSASASQGSCSGTSTVSCNLGSIASGAGATVTIVVLPTASGTLLNSATVSSGNPDPSSGNNTSSTSTTVNPAGGGGGQADLVLSGTAAPNPVAVGSQLTYTILVKNTGPDGAGNVTFTDTLPAGVTFVSSLANQGSCSASGGTVTCNLGTIAAGGTAGIDIEVVPNMAGTLVDHASATSSTTLIGNVPLVIVSTATAAAAGNAADLSVTATAAPNPVTVGSLLTYTLTVHNNGPNAAANVLASDTLPAGASLVSATTTQGTCLGTFAIACNLGTVAAGGSVKITIVVTPTQPGTATDHANVSGSNPDPDPGNNNATVTTTVNPATGGGSVTPADLSITKTASPNPVTVGSNLTYTLTVANAGPASATGVVASDNLPSGVTLVSVTPSQGTCSGTTAITCNLGTLAAGATATVAIVVTPTAVETLVNSATVNSNATDANPGNNTSTATVSVLPPGGAAQCRIDDAPAATLLIPYFAVDLSSPTGMDTYFTVVNSAAAPQLASVTLWSDWAIPVMTFDLYLTGYGMQTIDLRSILTSGKAPVTGPGVDAAGGLSSANQNFPGCNADNVAGAGARSVFLQRALSGRRVGGLCYATEKTITSAIGYVTVDAVNSCSTLNPSSPGYFASGGTGVASDDNVLLGDYYYSNPSANFAQGDAAVHIAADPASFGGNQYTFYARYVAGAGTDNRQPLGAVYGVHYLTTGEFDGTQLTVWRDTKSADASPVACGSLPPWAPLSTAQSVVWDEQEKNSAVGPGTKITPLATQLISVGSAALPLAPQAGWLALDLSHSATSLFGDQAQGWVTVLHSSTSATATWSQRAWHLDNACIPH
jgi:uncharacterized repeat protein (TIGR01451 family)